MITYIATKGKQGTYVKANTLKDAQDYVLANFGAGWTVTVSPEQPETLTPEQKAERHREFGKLLFVTFLNDNAVFASARGSNFTVEETQALDAKFGAFGRLCEYGSIPQIQILLPSIEVDTIFTQERKDKYITMVNNHLASNG
jgi:hypothetical protein